MTSSEDLKEPTAGKRKSDLAAVQVTAKDRQYMPIAHTTETGWGARRNEATEGQATGPWKFGARRLEICLSFAFFVTVVVVDEK